MRRTTLVLSFCLLATLVFALQFSAATLTVRVHEKATRVDLNEKQAAVMLAIENLTGREVSAQITLEVIDVQNKVKAKGEARTPLRAGEQQVRVPLTFTFNVLDSGDLKELPLYRLRYRVVAGDSADAPSSSIEGVVSLLEITPDLFELRVSASRRAMQGSLYRVRVQAMQPTTGQAVRGVQLQGEIELDSGARPAVLRANSVTDAEGYGVLDFNLPANVKDEDAYVVVKGRRNLFEQEAKALIEFHHTARIMLTTDKTLYQPGQTLHLRALVFNSTGRALPDASATFTIEDPEDTTVFRASNKTTRFGVATADWQVSDNTPLGDYSIKVELDDDSFEDSSAYNRIKISRYELPNFTVSARADRAYYLSGQNAEVEVRADYLFGQPVKRGHVKVVRETERRWNFKEQKWETEEGATFEGKLDDEGRFIARIDLKEEYEALSETSYARFLDLKYAAYVTDASTNRTEQRRFDLRLTKDPIHLYVAEANYRQAEGMPLAFYVVASYADGSPAECAIQMNIGESRYSTVRYYGQSDALKTGPATVPFAVVKTNRYGVAKVSGPPAAFSNASSRYLSINLSARDGKGRTGRHTEDFWPTNNSTVRVETDKAVYRAGEPVHALITSNKRDAVVFVEVANNTKAVRSEMVRLENGRASITFPYGKDFDGRLSVIASFYEPHEDNSYSDGLVVGQRVILYPRDRELKLDVKLAQTTYRPGEDAEATLRATTADGRALESVFGVVVFDKAVEERARTDAEFNSAYGFYNYFRHFRYGASEISGITLRDLDRLDVKRKPVPEDLNLVADILLQYENDDYEPASVRSNAYERDLVKVFGALIDAQLEPLKKALDARYDKTAEYPRNDSEVRSFLRAAEFDLDQLRDPWNLPYRLLFSIEGVNDVLEFVSAGADKEFGTNDDFRAQRFTRPYFRSLGERIDAAIEKYHEQTGSYVRDEATLRAALANAHIVTGDLLDRWGEPYKFYFGTSGTFTIIQIRSGGPDKRFQQRESYGTDDFTIWTTWVDTFSDTRTKIDAALNSYLQTKGTFPQDEASFREALKRAGVERERLLDPYGRVYYASFKSESRYVDRVLMEGVMRDGKQADTRMRIVPVSQRVHTLTLFSPGADAIGGTSDDFTAAIFTSIASEQSSIETDAQQARPLMMLTGATGAITGTVVDVNGAVIPGATVRAVNKYSSAEYSTVSNDEGIYTLRNLPSGYYTLSFNASGFNMLTMDNVPVRSSTLIKVNITLEVGNVSEAVTVTASADLVNTTDASMSNTVKSKDIRGPNGRAQLSTPRLREYFPETLLWQPSLETDSQGRALLRFKLADNITTWKMSVIGSTIDGEIGTAEKEFKAFQPFFVEHDPPRVLTEGDEIALPVVLRNYLDRPQSVDLQIKPESWFSLNGSAQKRAQILAGDSAREVFNFRATASVKDGKQRITALGEAASDAIERPVTVHPDGEERAETDSRIFTDTGRLETEIPVEAIKGSLRGELKIYPNLIGHVIEGIEGIMARPYGCGEQTISSTYPSLLVLRAYKRNRLEPPERIGARARRYLQSGYERLLSYRAEDGGFSYWGGRASADIALTAYALRFLYDAREFIEVDEEVVSEAREWLIKQQRADGGWPSYYYSNREKDSSSPATTALVARTLALYEKGGAKAEAQSAATMQRAKTQRDALRLALGFLERKAAELDDPYLIASYALAAMDAGEHERAARAIARLRTLAHTEGDGAYWSLETNTPFYGWGLAGRIETTALVLQALTRGDRDAAAGAKGEAATDAKSAATEDDELVNRSLLFLLKRKDRYGVWYSTQATVNVLDALIALLSSSPAPGDNAQSTALISINGKPAGTIQLPPAHQLTSPITVDVSKFISTGTNRLEITRAGGSAGGARLSAQMVTNFYLPWTKALSDETKQRSASALKLEVNFDKTELAVTNEVTCKVKAERVGSSGYGMMLAEIGLPPGADVDRASLERAMKESGWSFTRYDVLPDRLVVYLWPSAGGTNFEFKFRPRFGLKALTAPSVLYDYYNPEAHTTLAPVRFIVR